MTAGGKILEKLEGDEDQRRFFPIELDEPLGLEWLVPYRLEEPQEGEEEEVRQAETHGVKTLTRHQQFFLREYVQEDLAIPSEDEREILRGREAREVKKEKGGEGAAAPAGPASSPHALRGGPEDRLRALHTERLAGPTRPPLAEVGTERGGFGQSSGKILPRDKWPISFQGHMFETISLRKLKHRKPTRPIRGTF